MSEITGVNTLLAKLHRIAEVSDKALIDGLKISCEAIVQEAKEKCPVDTGNLRDSITYKIVGHQGIIYADCDYAGYVEFGTVDARPQPYMFPAFEDNKDKALEHILESINKAIRSR